MLDNVRVADLGSEIGDIPSRYLDAVSGLSEAELAAIDADIQFFEQSGVLRGRAMGLIRSLQTEKRAPRERIQLLSA